jgi:hypothetical protein
VIDFRYHLISIVAIFLALGIGILMGSLVLGESLVNQIENELEDIRRTNGRLRDSVAQLQEQIRIDEDFALLARSNLIGGELNGEEVVVFTYAGTDGALIDQVRASVEEAGGTVAATIEATDNLDLASPAERDQLALILGSSSSETVELHAELGEALGGDASAAANGEGPDGGAGAAGPSGPGNPAVEGLLADLEQADLVNLDGASAQEDLIPTGASFVVVGGASEDPPFRLAEYTVSLATSLASDGTPVVGAESTTSTWGMTAMLRVDDRAQDAVTTVDNAESITGSIALVLGLEEAENGNAGNHYGIGSGAERIIPEPAPAP